SSFPPTPPTDTSTLSLHDALPISIAVAAARLFGPVLASAAEGFWMLDAPINRASLLRSRLLAAVVLAGLAGSAAGALVAALTGRSEEHTSELQSRENLVCRLLLEK